MTCKIYHNKAALVKKKKKKPSSPSDSDAQCDFRHTDLDTLTWTVPEPPPKVNTPQRAWQKQRRKRVSQVLTYPSRVLIFTGGAWMGTCHLLTFGYQPFGRERGGTLLWFGFALFWLGTLCLLFVLFIVLVFSRINVWLWISLFCVSISCTFLSASICYAL